MSRIVSRRNIEHKDERASHSGLMRKREMCFIERMKECERQRAGRWWV